MSSLFIAARTGCVNDLKSSISAGADVNEKDINGSTPLFHGCFRGHMSIVKALIAAGADVNEKNVQGTTPLFEGFFGGHTSIVKTLIAAGADVNDKGGLGSTALFHSVVAGDMDMSRVLIAAGADVNTKGIIGGTPLIISIMTGRMDFVKLLIAAGADVNLTGAIGLTPLDVCATSGRMDIASRMGIAKVLIAAGSKAVDAEYISPETEVGKALIKYLLLYQYRSIMKSKGVRKSVMCSKMWNECKKQVKEMGETRLGGSSTSFFEFMTETDKNKLALYLSKKKFGIKSKRGKISYMKKFPMYLEDIEAQFKIGNERECLLLKSQKLLTHCFCYMLPQEVIGKISEFMTNEDIQSFLTVNNSLK